MKRRNFISGLTTSFGSGLALAGIPRPIWRPAPRLKDGVQVRGTAKNLIFILLDGAPSHVDTFDLKVGSYTPNFLGAQTMASGIRWPAGTMPKLAQRMDQFSIVRSISAIEAVHERAVYHVLTGHRLNPATTNEIPHFASMLSYKLGESRTATDSLPTVVRVGKRGPDNGFLGDSHLGLNVNEAGQVDLLEHPFSGEAQRLSLLNGLMTELKTSQDNRAKLLQFQNQAKDMMLDPELKNLFGSEEEDISNPYDLFQAQCEMAVKVLDANKGGRVVQLAIEGWDHHSNIYDDQSDYGFGNLSRTFDNGFAYLLDEMAAIPSKSGSGTLLDETLIVALGEFGRTIGNLNTDRGRDHFPYVVPALFAGGGVKPGRVVGSSNNQGEFIVDQGWSQNRYMGINDVVATMFSALGVDWTERFTDTPSGRLFEIVDTAEIGPIYEIDSLFL